MKRAHQGIPALGLALLLAGPTSSLALLHRVWPTVEVEILDDATTLQCEGYRKRIKYRRTFATNEVSDLLDFYGASKHTPVLVKQGSTLDPAVYESVRRDMVDYGVLAITREIATPTNTLTVTETFTKKKPAVEAVLAEPPPVTVSEPEEPGAQDKALWDALMEAVPKEFRKVDVFAVNPSRSMVCFRSKGKTLLFWKTTGRVDVVYPGGHSTAEINRITYELDREGFTGAFILWAGYERQARLDAIP